ncbi:MAG TPA: prepilin-type N-terminal cleavage/methylation domain-containing protein [Kofleriaceae bacterium]|nr:prepilin-type N-terminal cleavage/methylation domain-containing protein [Kofleriaceae bacterium]
MGSLRDGAGVTCGARRRQRGFTLLELLITLGITTIALIGLLSLHVSLVRGNDSASRFAEATQIGQAALESLRAARTGGELAALLTGNAGDTPPLDVPWCRRGASAVEPTATGRGGMTFRCRVAIEPLTTVSGSLWRIRVEVGWTDEGAAQGAQGGALDHLIAVEVIRSVEVGL